MRNSLFVFASFIMMLGYTNCGGKGFSTVDVPAVTTSSSLSNGTGSIGSGGSGSTSLNLSGSNVVPLNVGSCGGYVNEPCITVTICQSGTSNCQTIPNILLDTGSFGLRLFSSVVNLSLPAKTTSAGGTLTECVSYMDGSSQWGPVKVADVVLGGLLGSSVPIQIIDSSFGSVPSSCTGVAGNDSPANAGFNGIIGVGFFKDDCGAGCALSANNGAGIYFSCPASGPCTGSAAAIPDQVSNPVHFLSSDNNGVIVSLPDIPASGAVSIDGSLILGIGTRANNTFSGLTILTADGNGNFQTTFNGSNSTGSFIDSGSNGLFFPGSSVLPNCTNSGVGAGYFCPTSDTALSAVQKNSAGSVSTTVNFDIMNGDTAFDASNPNWVFKNVGGNISTDFDWGLPFFFGRNVVVGFDGHSSLASGPFWAF